MFKIKGRHKEMSSKFIKNADIHAPGRTQALKTMGTAHNVTLPHDRLTCFTNIEFICLYILCRLLKNNTEFSLWTRLKIAPPLLRLGCVRAASTLAIFISLFPS